MDLGIFLPVAIMSSSAPADPPTFELNKWIAQEAEKRGFHFLLAQSVWRGHGGKTDFWNTSLEGFTLMSSLGAVTSRIGLVASCQPLLYPPAVAAKMVATADEISGGRFGINVVAGGNLSEAEQMGLLPERWGDIRYDYADEWTTALKSLWSQEHTTTTGAYIRLDDCVSGPKPVQKPYPPIIAAGASAKGASFTAKHASHAFIAGHGPGGLAAVNARYKAAAAANGRTLKTYTTLYCHIEDTAEEASAYYDRLLDNPDLAAIADLMGQYSRAGSGESLKKPAEYEPVDHMFFGAFLSSTADGIAGALRALQESGIDGVLLHFSEWRDDLVRFSDEVLPLVPGMFAAADAGWTSP
jgi:pyrimidine oxygenase